MAVSINSSSIEITSSTTVTVHLVCTDTNSPDTDTYYDIRYSAQGFGGLLTLNPLAVVGNTIYFDIGFYDIRASEFTANFEICYASTAAFSPVHIATNESWPSASDQLIPATSDYPSVLDQWVWGAGDGPEANRWQGQAGCCVANALVTAMEIFGKKAGHMFQSSVGWIYGNRLPTDIQGELMVTSQALDRLKADGVPMYTLLPENENVGPYVWRHPDTYYYEDWPDGGQNQIGAKTLVSNNYNTLIGKARLNKIKDWDTFTPAASNVQAIKDAIRNNGVALVEFTITYNFDYLGGEGCDGIVQPPYNFFNSQHLSPIYGWKTINNKTYWIGQANWGNLWWGDSGKFYMPIDYTAITAYYTLEYDRPAAFAWNTAKVQGEEFDLTAIEWNDLIQNVKNMHIHRLGDYSAIAYPMVEAVKRNNFTANHFNRVRFAIGSLNSTGIATKTSYAGTGEPLESDKLKADDLNTLVTKLNEVK